MPKRTAAELVDVVQNDLLRGLLEDCGEDFGPMAEFLDSVTIAIEALGVPMTDPAARLAWCEIVNWGSHDLNHNPYLPCGWCENEFLPSADETLLTLWLGRSKDAWRCPACGGTVVAKSVRERED